MSKLNRKALVPSMLLGAVHAKLDWNLETSFLHSLHQLENEASPTQNGLPRNNSTDAKKSKGNKSNQLFDEVLEEEHEFVLDPSVVHQTAHVYPAWVSDTTCSTFCVDLHNEEEFCVATSICQRASWQTSYERYVSTLDEPVTPAVADHHLEGFLEAVEEQEVSDKGFTYRELYDPWTSVSKCSIWDKVDRCDGTLCDEDHECLSGCCGGFVSFTHKRCLPQLGDYCAGRDQTRLDSVTIAPEPVHAPSIHERTSRRGRESEKDYHLRRQRDLSLSSLSSESSSSSSRSSSSSSVQSPTRAEESSESVRELSKVSSEESVKKESKKAKKHDSEEKEKRAKREAHAREIMERMKKETFLVLQQQEANLVPDNTLNNSGSESDSHYCKEVGALDLCDDQICAFDANCRSGCCSQVLGDGYHRCVPMLVGDYCPRALDPVTLLTEIEHKRAIERQKRAKKEAQRRREALLQSEVSEESGEISEEVVPTKHRAPLGDLPCNVFGTTDRCDGMACEHDGHCFSGCCSLFVSNQQKRCMPLIHQNMCPSSIDVVVGDEGHLIAESGDYQAESEEERYLTKEELLRHERDLEEVEWAGSDLKHKEQGQTLQDFEDRFLSMLPHEQTLLAEAEFTERIHEKEMGIEREELHPHHEHRHKEKEHHQHSTHHHSHHHSDEQSAESDSDSDDQHYEIVEEVPEDVYLEEVEEGHHQDYHAESHHQQHHHDHQSAHFDPFWKDKTIFEDSGDLMAQVDADLHYRETHAHHTAKPEYFVPSHLTGTDESHAHEPGYTKHGHIPLHNIHAEAHKHGLAPSPEELDKQIEDHHVVHPDGSLVDIPHTKEAWKPQMHITESVEERVGHWEDEHFMHHKEEGPLLVGDPGQDLSEFTRGHHREIHEKQKESPPEPILKPKAFDDKHDPKFLIPQGKATPIKPATPAKTEEEQKNSPQTYGEAYEHAQKAQKKQAHHQGIAPKTPIEERFGSNGKDISHSVHPNLRKPCSAYGFGNKCEGISCSADDECASGCCGRMTKTGHDVCQNLINGNFCPRTVAPKVDYPSFTADGHLVMPTGTKRQHHIPNSLFKPTEGPFSEHVPSRSYHSTPSNSLTHDLKHSNELANYKGKKGCEVEGSTNQCDGQPCDEDSDCFSGCCGNFISFSLRRCLPLTEDSMCPRFLEPSWSSPIPSNLPPIEETIANMYQIQDRIEQIDQILSHQNALSVETNNPNQIENKACRISGNTDLCDGHNCNKGSECMSGCCGSFGNQRDFCLPRNKLICPSSNHFNYGPDGVWIPDQSTFEEEGALMNEEQESDSIPLPAEFTQEGATKSQKKENAFWTGVIAGVAIWVFVLATVTAVCLCYRKEEEQENEESTSHSKSQVAQKSSENYRQLKGEALS